ncbi:hypothetical protein IGI39_004288 [Enterococcus sp. AZ135]|uniref:TetR/AcrR family transcriptional regulator n=1 Tax=unclassified Enterococcus TaxID=2608891 RepID=UPI003F21DD68
MYHVSKDKRAQKSAELIWIGLETCLLEKELKTISITDIHEKSFVSRATFYRLFDSVEDVLIYRCDQIYQVVAEELSQKHMLAKNEVFLFLIDKWLDQKTLLKTLTENNLINIIYDTHMKNSNLVKQLFIQESEMTNNESDYLVSILTSILPAVINIWYMHGQTEKKEELYTIVWKSLSTITDVLSVKS